MPNNDAPPLIDWLNRAFRYVRRSAPDTNFINRLFAQFFHVRTFGRLARISHPETFNEHIVQLKTSDAIREPLRCLTSDKEYAKTYIAGILGSGMTPKTLAVIKDAREIVEDRFPWPSVVKPTHSSQKVLIIRDKTDITAKSICEIKNWLSINFFEETREPQYKYLTPKIIIEEYIPSNGNAPEDVKVFCFQGMAKFMQVDFDRMTNHTRGLYAMDGTNLRIAYNRPASQRPFPFEGLAGEIKGIAERLAAPFSFVRVDLYVAQGRLWVGELTHTPVNGRGRFQPKEADRALGRLFQDASLDVMDLLTGIDH